MIHHRGILNRLLWMQEAYSLTSADTVLQKTPYGFDVSVWEFFLPLMAGARLVEARPGGHRDPTYLVEEMEREGVTTVHFVPSMLRAFVEEVGEGQCGSVRLVVASGEALGAELAERARMKLGREVENLYGPTEASVDVTRWRCEAGAGEVPIGRPIWNTRMYVMEEGWSAGGEGMRGELMIGGEGLARGYAGRAELTAERFVPDGMSGRSGERVYRTGDVGRWRATGR